MITLSLPTVSADCRPDRDRLLADIEMAEAADQAEAVELAGPLLEAADEQHLAVEFEQLVLRRLVALGLGGRSRLGMPAAPRGGFLRGRASAPLSWT